MSVTADLLPPSALPQERALSLAVKRAAEVDTPLRKLWIAADCRADLLPWLAWALAVEPWDTAWTEDQKRAAISAAYTVHARRGTLAAIETAVNALGYGAAVIEENAEAPFTFSVRLESPAAGVGESQLREVEEVANRTKNARSHLLSLISVLAAGVGNYSAAATTTGITLTVYPAA